MTRATWEGAGSSAGPAALAAIGALCAGILLFEIDLLRIFSFTLWHHFTFMVISVALLGFGVSGVALQLFPALGEPPARKAGWYAAAFAASAVLAVVAVTRIPLDPRLLLAEPAQLLGLCADYVLLLVPFAFAGLAIATLLKGLARSASRLYAADLAGAGAGCVVIVAVLEPLGAEGVLFLAAGLAMLGAWLLERASGTGGRGSLAWLAAALVPIAAIPWAPVLLDIPPGPGKGLARFFLDAEKHPDARLVFTGWSALGRVDVVERTGKVPWTLNPASGVPVPPQTQIVIDGDASTPIVETTADPSDLAFLDYTLTAGGLQAFRPRDVLVIGAGGGLDVLTALREGAKRVDAVEINPVIVDLVTGRFAERGGRLFARPEVTLHNEEGRAFLRRHPGRYGAILLSLIDTWAASASGAYSLAEGYLYTVEAFREYLRHLDPGGVLIMTRWRWSPPRETLRLCSVAAEALRREGAEEPGAHVVVLSLINLGSVLVKREPFTREEIRGLEELAAARGYSFLYAPGAAGDNAFVRFFRSDDPARFMESYPYDITPVTDDSPFFFQFGRWRDANPFGKAWSEHPLVLSGRLVLLTVLLQAAALSLLLLVVPLLSRGRRGARAGPPAWRALAYFFLIGLAFMLLEIVLMQRFTLFLGSPVHATAVVLAALLAFAGLGSALARRLAPAGRAPAALFAGIVAIATLYAFVLPAVFRATLGAGLPGRALISVALLAPLGLLLGVPFPAAIERLHRAGVGDLIGWAWAANGCASVIGPVLAVMLAMDAGFAAVTVLGAAAYAAAFLVAGPLWRGGRDPGAGPLGGGPPGTE